MIMKHYSHEIVMYKSDNCGTKNWLAIYYEISVVRSLVSLDCSSTSLTGLVE